MFDWLWNRKLAMTEFPGNEEAFAHACAVGYEPRIGGLIPALVEEEGEPGRDGEHTFLIRLARAGGGLRLWSCVLKETRHYPQVGEFVGFRIVTIASDLPENASLIGYIACRLEPVFVKGKGWRVARSYTPKDIKPEIRF